jgi:hypothetical protein
VVHKNILTGILGDKAKPFFIVEPLNFATGHNELLNFRGTPEIKKTRPKISRA